MIHLPIRKTSRRAISLVKNSFIEKSLVLIYHRVIDLENDPQQLAVSIKNFESQISHLKSNYQIKTLQQIVSDIKQRQIVNKSVAITFDDGYFDNKSYALPILEKLQIPATIFISTNYVDKADEFWWDKLESVLLLSTNLPPHLELKINTEVYIWNDCNSRREQIYQDIHKILKAISISEIPSIIKQLVVWSGSDYHPRQKYRPVSQSELIEMSKSPYVEIGAHTMSHCRLSNESAECQRNEIEGSKLFLEKLLNKKILSFSYPFGTYSDYTDFTPGIVKQMEYNCGISNNQDLVTKNTDVYSIPRYLVRNWNSTEFANRINNMFRFGPE